MDCKTTSWLCALYLTLIVWLYHDVSSTELAYNDAHSHLVDSSTGERMRRGDIAGHLRNIVQPTEEYLNKTNAIGRLFDLAQQMSRANFQAVAHHHYSDWRQLEQSGWPVANQTRCALQLGWIQTILAVVRKEYALLNGRVGQELTQLLDSFGKQEPGFYSGALTWPGSHELCKRTSLDGGKIRTRYCLAMMRLKMWPERSEFSSQSGPRERVEVGICLPETCDTLSFEAQQDRIEALIKLELGRTLRKNLVLESMFCLPDERSPIRQLPTSGWIFLTICGAWLLLVVLASLVTSYLKVGRKDKSELSLQLEPLGLSKSKMATHKSFLGSGISKVPSGDAIQEATSTSKIAQDDLTITGPSSAAKILSAFSIQNSWAVFKPEPTGDKPGVRDMQHNERARVNLAILDSVRFMMVLAIVVFQGAAMVNLYATSTNHKVEISGKPAFYMFGAAVARLVDTFFVMSGLLAAYGILGNFQPDQLSSPLTWLLVNLRTFLRLSPVYFLVYGFARTIEPYTGEGPWWDYGVSRHSMRGRCTREPWWRSILYLSGAGRQHVSTCVPVAWLMVVLVQVSLLVPPIVLIIYKLQSNLSRHVFLAFITLISGLQIALKTYQQSPPGGEAFGSQAVFSPQQTGPFMSSLDGASSIGCLSCVAYGCYVGYLLHLYQNRDIQRWPRWLVSKVTLFLIILGHFMVLVIPLAGSMYVRYFKHVSMKYELAGLHVFSMIVWPTLNGLLIISAVTVSKDTRLCRALSQPSWRAADNLSLALYLVHWNLMSYLHTSYDGGPSRGYLTDAFKLSSLGLVASLILSFLMTILYDMPLRTLLSRLMDKLQALVSRSKTANITTRAR